MRRLTFQLAFVAGLTLAMSAQVNAQIFTNASGDGLWSTAANWDTGVVPVATDNVVIGEENNTGVTGAFDVGAATINDLRVGNGAGSLGATGTFNQGAGTLTANGWAFVGSDANTANASATAGVWNLSGTASFVTPQRLYAGIGGGAGATGTGTINVSDSASIMADITVIGENDGNSGIVNQSGGSVASSSWLTIGAATAAQGEYNLSGGTLSTAALTVGQADAGSNGDFNLSGTGAATVDGLWVGRGEFGGGGATGSLDIDGSNASFLVNNDVHFGGFNFAAADAVGDLSFTADAGGVSTLDIAGSLFLNDGTVVGASNLFVDLTADANFSTFGSTGTAFEYLLIDNFNNGVTGTFAGLAEGASISIGGGQTGTISYVGGDGNDVVINLFTTAIPEPSSVLIASLGLLGLVARRRRS